MLYTRRTHMELSFDIPKGFIEQLYIDIMDLIMTAKHHYKIFN